MLENPEFLRFARHWTFRIRACRLYRATTKGKVERPVRYVRGNFIYGREFVGDADLDAQRAHWLEHVANARLHRTIGAVPRERFEANERRLLHPLASRSYPAGLAGGADEPAHPADHRARRRLGDRGAAPLTSYGDLLDALVEERA